MLTIDKDKKYKKVKIELKWRWNWKSHTMYIVRDVSYSENLFYSQCSRACHHNALIRVFSRISIKIDLAAFCRRMFIQPPLVRLN